VFSERSNVSGTRGRVLLVLLLAVAITAGCRSLPRDFEPGDSTYAVEPAAEGQLADFSGACQERFADEESCFLLLDRNDEDLWWRLALID